MPRLAVEVFFHEIDAFIEAVADVNVIVDPSVFCKKVMRRVEEITNLS